MYTIAIYIAKMQNGRHFFSIDLCLADKLRCLAA